MTWTKMLVLALVMVACTERVVEAITGRGQRPGDRARRKPTPPAPTRTERQELTDEFLTAVSAARARQATITDAWANTIAGATS